MFTSGCREQLWGGATGFVLPTFLMHTRHLPPAATAAAQALKSVRICAICVPLLPWVSLLSGGEFVHRWHRFSQICPPPADHAVRGGGGTRRVVRVRVRQITWVAAMPRCAHLYSVIEQFRAWSLHTPPAPHPEGGKQAMSRPEMEPLYRMVGYCLSNQCPRSQSANRQQALISAPVQSVASGSR